MNKSPGLLALAGLLLSAPSAFAAQPSSIDSGDTAWIMAATALVLLMTIPGLALFYAGLVRERNVLSVLMHCFAITCLMSVLWLVVGFSLSFSGSGKYVGDFAQVFGRGLSPEVASRSIPDILFFAFQMTFFIITPALIVGTFAERMKFSSMLLFTALWSLLVYAPICHMVWAEGGWLYEMGVIDLAGGIVVHITAGFAALVACIMVGKRKAPQPPHNLPMTVTGAAMLWVGWFGFNGGSGLAANGAAAMAIVVTHLSAATAALTWMAIEWIWNHNRKPSMLGIATGSIAGLAAITPASGVVGPAGALVIGFCSGTLCWIFSVKIKARFGYDDSLDVFGVHGVG
ncbi:MAG: ammonium transporter, partial [Verrucomicrobiales bacterium]